MRRLELSRTEVSFKFLNIAVLRHEGLRTYIELIEKYLDNQTEGSLPTKQIIAKKCATKGSRSGLYRESR